MDYVACGNHPQLQPNELSANALYTQTTSHEPTARADPDAGEQPLPSQKSRNSMKFLECM